MLEDARVLFVDDDPDRGGFVTVALETAGWTVDVARDAAGSLRALAAARYDVVVLGVGSPGCDGLAVARAIRGRRPAAPTVPVLAFARTEPEGGCRIATPGLDGLIAEPVSAAGLVEHLSAWWPHPRGAARMRLVAAFGAAEIAALDESFGAQLADAVARIDEPGTAALAHRIAGIAGTLGFNELHEAWLALSDDEAGARGRAIDAARRVLRVLGHDRREIGRDPG